MTNMTNPSENFPSLDDAVASELGTLRLEVIKLRVSLQQTVQKSEEKMRAKDREIFSLKGEIESLKVEAAPRIVTKTIDAETGAANGASAH